MRFINPIHDEVDKFVGVNPIGASVTYINISSIRASQTESIGTRNHFIRDGHIRISFPNRLIPKGLQAILSVIEFIKKVFPLVGVPLPDNFLLGNGNSSGGGGVVSPPTSGKENEKKQEKRSDQGMNPHAVLIDKTAAIINRFPLLGAMLSKGRSHVKTFILWLSPKAIQEVWRV